MRSLGRKAVAIGVVVSLIVLILCSCGEQKENEEALEEIHDIPIVDMTEFEWNDLVISAKQVKRTVSKGMEIELLLENPTESRYAISTAAVILNNGMTDVSFECEIEANTTKSTSISVPFEILESEGIVSVGRIELFFDLHNITSAEAISKAGSLRVKLSDSSQPMVSGHILYDRYGVKIYGRYVDETTVWGSSVLLYVQNTSERNIRVLRETLTVNDEEEQGEYDEVIYAKRHSVDPISLSVNEITASDQITLQLKIVDADTMEEIATTNPIAFDAN